jgi:hypothetical protein
MGEHMNKFLVFLIALVAVAGCGAPTSDAPAESSGGAMSSQKPAKPEDAVVGTWKFDPGKSALAGMSDKEKEEVSTVVVSIMADGTFTTTSKNGETGKGTWTLKDKTVTFAGEHAPPEFTLADDGTLSNTMEEGGQQVTIVLAKS